MRTTLLDWPESEYIDGERFRKVSPKFTHAAVQATVLDIFRGCADDRGRALPEWRFRIGPPGEPITALVPDVAYVSRERLRKLSREEREEPPFGPDIAVEIRSPSHRAELLARKVRKYLSAGTVLVLDIDPASRTVVAYSRDDVAVFAGNDQFTHEAADWLHFRVSALFEELDRPD
ncbi:MAG: Uma2 family endonuclease [Candidatus Eremiobacteraeota bacterium]|nr:Uma2 family endonuclease [Candidatus Eremiobacteraeota bacterium]